MNQIKNSKAVKKIRSINTNNLLNNLVPNENYEVEFLNYLIACK
jgi:hypothetical protein